LQSSHADARDFRQIFRADERFASKTGKHQAHQIAAGILDRQARWQRSRGIEIIDAARLSVSLQQLLDSAVLAFVH
jgi:hypothetical protein